MRGTFALFLMCVLVASCVNRSGIAEFTSYKAVFDGSAAVSEIIIDKLAVGERLSAHEQRKAVGGVIGSFHPKDASIYSDLADPPLTAQYRRGLALMQRYNTIMLGYATGQGFEQLEGEIFSFANEAAAIVGLLSNATSLTTSSAPYIQTLREIADYAFQAHSRAVFRDRALLYHTDLILLLEEMRDGTVHVFPNLTHSIEKEILTELQSGRSASPALRQREEVRALLSGWVILLEPVSKGLSSWRGRDSELGVEAYSERPDVDASYPPPA